MSNAILLSKGLEMTNASTKCLGYLCQYTMPSYLSLPRRQPLQQNRSKQAAHAAGIKPALLVFE